MLYPVTMKRRNRRLFKFSESGDGNVVLNFRGSPKSELAILAEAYHRAAARLVKEFASRTGYWNDLDSVPIVFLYRHALELMLKAVLTIGNHLSALLQNPNMHTRDVFKNHSLAQPIATVKEIFKAVGWDLDLPKSGLESNSFEKIMAEFEQIDPGSFTFRYLMDKKGKSPLEKHFVFSVTDFAGVLDPILETLSGACLGLEEYRDMLAELHTEAMSDAADDFYADYYDFDPHLNE